MKLYEDVFSSLDRELSDIGIDSVNSLVIPEASGFTMVVFDYELFRILQNIVSRSPEIQDMVRVEFDEYRGLKLAPFVLLEAYLFKSYNVLKVYLPRDEHVFIYRCTATRCEEDSMIIAMVKRGLDMRKLIEDTIRFTEFSYRSKSKAIPAFEVYRVLKTFMDRGIIQVNSIYLEELLRISQEYILQKYWDLEAR